MSIRDYNYFKNKFENTLPIRGRTTETKPIGQRRRDWETVVKGFIVEDGALDAEGVTAYGAHLYQTDCVMYLPNGDIHVKTGGWATPSTAEFISRFLPQNMRCYKKYNKIWVDYASQAYPIDTTKPTVFQFNRDTDTYAIENPQPLHQKVIDRTKIKAAREKIAPFRNYANIMLKLADGWLSNDLVEQHAEPWSAQRDYWGRRAYKVGDEVMRSYEFSGSINKKTAEKVYNAMCADESQFPKLLCMICAASDSEESRIVKTEQVERKDYRGNPVMETITTREYKYKHTTIDNRINFFIKHACDVYTTKEVPVGKLVTNLL
jgi:hypothetical protein